MPCIWQERPESSGPLPRRPSVFGGLGAMKFDASPALPWPNRPVTFLSFRPIARCLSCDLIRPANDESGIPACPASRFVGRVNGRFVMTRSQELSSAMTECSRPDRVINRGVSGNLGCQEVAPNDIERPATRSLRATDSAIFQTIPSRKRATLNCRSHPEDRIYHRKARKPCALSR